MHPWLSPADSAELLSRMYGSYDNIVVNGMTHARSARSGLMLDEGELRTTHGCGWTWVCLFQHFFFFSTHHMNILALLAAGKLVKLVGTDFNER